MGSFALVWGTMVQLKTVRTIRLRYVVGLSIIALLATASYFAMQRVGADRHHLDHLANLAQNQSELAHRIARLSNLMALAKTDTEYDKNRAHLRHTINALQDAHRELRGNRPAQGQESGVNKAQSTIYADAGAGLDQTLGRFVDQADEIRRQEFGELVPSLAAYTYVTESGLNELVTQLESVAGEFQRLSALDHSRIENLKLALWLSALAILLLLAFLIFYPMERQIRRTIRSLESSIEELTEIRGRLQVAQRLASIGDWELLVKEGVLTWSDEVYEICGVKKESFALSIESSRQLVHPEDRTAVFTALQKVRKRRSQVANLEYRIVRPDGTERLVYQSVAGSADRSGQINKLTGTIQDISDRRDISNRLEKLSETIPGFMFEFQIDLDGIMSIPYASVGILDTIGVTAEDARRDPRDILEMFHIDDLARINITIYESAEKLSIWQDQFRIHHPRKREIWIEGHATPRKLFDGSTHWYGYLWDITERKQSEDRIRQLALYDPLTGLANRRLLEDRLRHALATSRRSRSFSAILMLDLDHFKSLNDTKGHHVGDELLREVAQRLRKCVRDTDTIARLGGDEFVVLLESLGSSVKNGHRTAMKVAEKIRVTLNQTYYLDNKRHIHHASASIGVALFQGHGRSYGELLKRADVAMFEAKDLGRNRVCFFTEQRQSIINSRTAMAHDMQRALENGEFQIYYQPQVSTSGIMAGAEALLRWQPPSGSGKFIPPATFIPIAEETGLIIPLGEWVLRTVCRHILNFCFYNLPAGFAVAVNISARQFSDDEFLNKVAKIIKRTGVDTHRLKLELTESCLIHDMERGKKSLKTLREMGLHIELDDFGTGYSSLNSLKNLPLDTIKIDSSLVHGIEGDIRDEAIVRAAIAMGKALSLTVVAEGVETTEHNDFLIKEGCDMLQGFLHAKPLPYRTFLTYLQQQEKLLKQKFNNEAERDTSKIVSIRRLHK